MQNYNDLKELLDQNHLWPDVYVFKFIVKEEMKGQLLNLLVGFEISENFSKNKSYVSVTAKKMVISSDEVIDIYKKVSHVPTLLSI